MVLADIYHDHSEKNFGNLVGKEMQTRELNPSGMILLCEITSVLIHVNLYTKTIIIFFIISLSCDKERTKIMDSRSGYRYPANYIPVRAVGVFQYAVALSEKYHIS